MPSLSSALALLSRLAPIAKCLLRGGTKAENVVWFLGTALTMGENSILVGNVLAGSSRLPALSNKLEQRTNFE